MPEVECPMALIRVRACANLPGLHFGDVARVDPGDPYIAGLLSAALLVAHPEGGTSEPPATEAIEDEAGASADEP